VTQWKSATGNTERSTGGEVAAGILALLREVALVLVIALGLSLLIKTFLVQAFYIPSASMQNTLQAGDRVLVSKLTPGPLTLRHGDIVVFSDPGGWLTPVVEQPESPVRKAIRSTLTFVGLLPSDTGEHLIKRVIGLPGDKVACCDANGKITVDGVAITEPYLYPGNRPSDIDFSVTVPAGRIWVMGDHRSVSEDSRFHRDVHDGTVPIDDVVGKAFVVVWPPGRMGALHNPESVFARVPAR
jgi:signal peptidase I